MAKNQSMKLGKGNRAQVGALGAALYSGALSQYGVRQREGAFGRAGTVNEATMVINIEPDGEVTVTPVGNEALSAEILAVIAAEFAGLTGSEVNGAEGDEAAAARRKASTRRKRKTRVGG
ncbi:MAG: hypothetical protein KDE53_19510 [Caldilineaceae bacterium]|nr:hypothetical protein [Caldilineaceae bacterium]